MRTCVHVCRLDIASPRPRFGCSRTDIRPDNDHTDTPAIIAIIAIDALFCLSFAGKLVAMGFEEDEAREHVEPVQQEFGGPSGLFAAHGEALPEFRHTVTALPETVAKLKELEFDGVTVHDAGAGAIEIAVAGRLDNDLKEAILGALPKSQWSDFAPCVREAPARRYGAAARTGLRPLARPCAGRAGVETIRLRYACVGAGREPPLGLRGRER